jgi:glycerol-3-phosphate cytidylyltransferase-like family protein
MLSVLGCKYVSDVLMDAPYVLSSDMISALNISIVVNEVRDSDSDSTSGDGGKSKCNG